MDEMLFLYHTLNALIYLHPISWWRYSCPRPVRVCDSRRWWRVYMAAAEATTRRPWTSGLLLCHTLPSWHAGTAHVGNTHLEHLHKYMWQNLFVYVYNLKIWIIIPRTVWRFQYPYIFRTFSTIVAVRDLYTYIVYRSL